MNEMSRIDAVIDEVVNLVIDSTIEWVRDGEAIDDMVSFIGIEVADAIFSKKIAVEVDGTPYVIGHAISRALVEAKLLGLGPTKGDPRFGFINVG